MWKYLGNGAKKSKILFYGWFFKMADIMKLWMPQISFTFERLKTLKLMEIN